MAENKQKENAEIVEETVLEKVDGGSADSYGSLNPRPDIAIPAEVRENEPRIAEGDVDFRKRLEEFGIDVKKAERKRRSSDLGLARNSDTPNSDKLA